MLANWLSACRLHTIPATLTPIFIGTMISSTYTLSVLILVVVSGGFIQIGTNLANDYFDYKNKADTKERLGPLRATSAGLISPKAMKRGIIITFSIAFLVGLLLVARGGWPIFFIGVASIIAGILYTGGPYPLGYNGLGDLFVIMFFGPIAVSGTVYLHSFEFSREIFLIGFAPGLLSVAILAVNNLRDIKEDLKTGKRTLAVYFGANFAKYEYVTCLFIAVAIPIFLKYIQGELSPKVWIIVLTLAPAYPLIKTVLTKEGKILNQVLAKTGKIMSLYTVLFYLAY